MYSRYLDRLNTLDRAYKSVKKSNDLYLKASEDVDLLKTQLGFIEGLNAQLRAFDLKITEQESVWREAVLSTLEAEITDDLAWVYPTDGYRVSLASKVSRGKIHIEAIVSSIATKQMPGKIRGTQGRLFQQIVSFAALIGVMTLLGKKTVYVDEAFSGSSKGNVRKLNALLNNLKERGYSLIMIAQDTSIADGIDANRLLLSKSLDNKTEIVLGG